MSGRRRNPAAARVGAAVLVLLLLSGCGTANEPAPRDRVELLVSAAASLQGSLDRIGEAFAEAYPEIRVTMNYGASGALRQQIEQGAPADLFISADTMQMERLVAGGLIGDNAILLGNLLTLVVPADAVDIPDTPDDLASSRYRTIAIGDPGLVPAGSYAVEALRNAGLWERLEPKLVYGKDVRQVLAWIETGNADAGFVYRTDALQSAAVREAFTLPEDLYPPVRYPAGIVKGTNHPDEAAVFYEFLTGGTARRLFEADGFVFLHPAGRASP